MRYEDERYVRLYTRDTTTWTMLPWQSRCLLPLLIRKLDRAGVLDVLEGEEAAALSSLLLIPAEVIEVGLAALIGRRVVVLEGGRLLMPNFLEAQECSQSDKVRKQISREKAAQPSAPSQIVTDGHKPSQTVTDGHNSSHLVTPSRAEPCLAVPSRLKDPAGEKPPAEPKPPKTLKLEKPPDPRHAPMVAALVETYREVTLGAEYDFGGRDAKAVAELLAKSDDDALIVFKWSTAVRLSLDKFHTPKTRTIPDLVRDWNAYPAVKNASVAREIRL